MGPQLTKKEEEQIQEIMTEYEDIMALKHTDIRKEAIYLHDIDTGDHRPIKEAPYPLSPNYRSWVQNELGKLLEAGIIRRSKSPWSAPVVIAPKKGNNEGELAPRFCVNYKKINNITYKDAYPIPRIDDLLSTMSRAKIFSAFDLYSGYHQIGMTPRAIERSAFVTPYGHYEFLRMPFGLCNAPATFQRAMNELFEDLIGEGVLVYLDDINIYSETFDEHILMISEVLERIRGANLLIKPKKCQLGMEQMEYLGFIIGKDGVIADPKKIEAITKYPRPETPGDVRSFLGLAQFYRRFIRNFSTIAVPLYELTKGTTQYTWNQPQERAFAELKKRMSEPPVLARPNFESDEPFIVYTDASKFGLGAILSQKGEDGYEHVINFASKRTSATQEKYGATELECLGAVWAIRNYRPYLEGRRFILVTDHKALEWLFDKRNPQGKFARWIMEVQGYRYDIEYRPGNKHANVDALSRIYNGRTPRPPTPSDNYTDSDDE
jgi:hypothetical protein